MMKLFVYSRLRFSSSSAREKANYAHDGSSNRPKREFFDLTDLERKSINDKIRNYIASKF